jgi:hypothetical protein
MLVRFRRFAIASALVVPAAAGLSVVSAGAAAPPQIKAVAVHSTPLVTGPNTNLTGSGTTVVFSPKKLTGLTAVSDADCASDDYSFSISNTTAKKQTLTEGGVSTGFKVPAHAETDFCVFNDGTLKLGLKSSPAAKLKLVATS